MAIYIGITAQINNSDYPDSLYIYKSDDWDIITNQVLMDVYYGFNLFVAGIETDQWEPAFKQVESMLEETFDIKEAYSILYQGVDNCLKSGLIEQEYPGVYWAFIKK